MLPEWNARRSVEVRREGERGRRPFYRKLSLHQPVLAENQQGGEKKGRGRRSKHREAKKVAILALYGVQPPA